MTESITPTDDAYRGSIRLIVSTLNHKLTAYARDASKLGSVEQLVIDMFTGKAEYAVLSFGGFLGLGQKYHPARSAICALAPMVLATSSMSIKR